MKLTHVHQTFVEKPYMKCPSCGRIVFRSRWVVQISEKRTVLCEACVDKVRKEADKVFMRRIKELVDDAKKVKGIKTPGAGQA